MNQENQTLLEVKDLRLCYELEEGIRTHALNGISLRVSRGKRLGLVGESGCGKSTVAKAILRLLPANAKITTGRIFFKDQDLISASEKEMEKIRWSKISFVTQSAMNALNPVARIFNQMVETFTAHGDFGKKEILQKSRNLFEQVGLSKDRLFDYPHQFSGGMRQRVIIAMAVALVPELIIADEPTTALDVIMQAQIIQLLRALSEAQGISLVLITHDLAIVGEICQTVGIMYAGYVVEYGSIDRVFNHPCHPYTMGLKGAFPTIKDLNKRLISIPGSPPRLIAPLLSCGFSGRCPFSMERLPQRDSRGRRS